MAGNLDFRLNLLANTTGLQQGMDGARFALNALAGAMAALGVGLGIRELAQAADSYTNLSARINIATRDGGDFTSAMAGVHQVALATNSSLDATGDLFTRLNGVGKEMGMTQQNSLDLTKTINQAIQTSGGSAEASEAAVQQFIQAMQGGVLRGEEFNSIMEGGYGVAEALAKGLGVTTGELRKMAENGELGAERVYKALLSQKDAVQETFDQFPTTIGNAIQRITTSWEILIGKMDQSNGASATVADWLVTIADNMGVVETLLEDIGEGFVWVGDQLKKIDPATIEALKTALVSAYDAIKSMASSLGNGLEIAGDQINSVLGAIFEFNSGVDTAADKTNGLTKLLQALNVAFGFINDGFSGIAIAANLLSGAVYAVAGGFVHLKSKILLGDAKDAAIKEFQELTKKSDEYYQRASDGAMEFKSKGVEAVKEIGKTQAEKNQERITDNQQTLDQLKAQEEKHKVDYKAISDERIQLNQQLQDARKSGDQSAIDAAINGLAQLDAKEKEYQAESKKITDAKIQAAQVVANAMIKSADAAGLAQLKVLNAQLAAQGLQGEFDSTGKIIVKAMDDGAKATENQGNATDKARKAAVALGLDLDVSLNRVSAKFKEGETNVNNFVAGLEGLGVTGKQAGEVTYEAWEKWAEQAKSPAEIEAAKAKLLEFEKQGVFSAKQVEMGMRYLDEVNGKLPANISEVEKAYKLLGITSREEANKMAAAQMRAFDVMQKSGTASTEQMKKALINMADKIYASGDAAKIATYESKLAYYGLSSEIDSTGKASVKAMDEWTKSNDRVRNSAESIGDGYRNAGSIAREEAKSTEQAWADAVDAASAQFDAEMKRQGQSLSKGIYNYNSYSKADVLSQLKSKGYSDKEADKLAGSIWSKAMEADRDAKAEGLSKGGNPALKLLIEQEFNNASAKGLTTQHGTNKINDLLRQMSSNNLVSTGSTSKAPAVDVNSLAPQVSTPVPSTTATPTSRTVQNNISINGKTISIPVAEENQGNFNDFLSELEMLKKGM